MKGSRSRSRRRDAIGPGVGLALALALAAGACSFFFDYDEISTEPLGPAGVAGEGGAAGAAGPAGAGRGGGAGAGGGGGAGGADRCEGRCSAEVFFGLDKGCHSVRVLPGGKSALVTRYAKANAGLFEIDLETKALRAVVTNVPSAAGLAAGPYFAAFGVDEAPGRVWLVPLPVGGAGGAAPFEVRRDALGPSFGVAIDGDSAFWGESARGAGDAGPALHRAAFDDMAVVRSGAGGGGFKYVSVEAEWLYATDQAGGRIVRARARGDDLPLDAVAPLGAAPYGIATRRRADGGGERTYVAYTTGRGGAGFVRIGPAAGEAFEAPVPLGADVANLVGAEIAIDGAGAYVYWALRLPPDRYDGAAAGRVYRARLEAGAAPEALSDGEDQPNGIDVYGRDAYWCSAAGLSRCACP